MCDQHIAPPFLRQASVQREPFSHHSSRHHTRIQAMPATIDNTAHRAVSTPEARMPAITTQHAANGPSRR